MAQSMARLARKLKQDVAAIALPEGRTIGSLGHDKAKRYLLARMEELGLEPYEGDSLELPYSWEGDDFVNLVGVLPGTSPSAKPVLIGAHYDSVIPAPCADDNASSVAIALAAAEILSQKKLPRDVVIAIFDAEEPRHFLQRSMGSIRFYEDHARDRGVHAALIMDMMGHDVVVAEAMLDFVPWLGPLARMLLPRIGKLDVVVPGIRDLFFMSGAESHPDLANAVDTVRVPRRLRLIATLNKYVGDVSDHHVFRKNGVPYLFFSCGRWRHYHEKTDTIEKLNFAKMARMTQYLVAVTEDLATKKFKPHDDGPVDTAEFEIRRIKRTCGVAFPYVLKLLGVEKLETRADISALASRLLDMGI
jgi:peptidase M28-like protein